MNKQRLFLFFCVLLLLFMLTSCKSINYFTDFIDKTVELYSENAKATGTLVDDGIILTNKHFVEDSEGDIFARFYNDDEEFLVTVMEVSDDYDLALLSINKETSYFEMESEYLAGDEVYTLSNSNGYGLSLLKGNISSGNKTITYKDKEYYVIQTNLEIFNGSSGAPLYNKEGKLIGIMTLRIYENNMLVPGMSFAIPVENIRTFLKEAKVK